MDPKQSIESLPYIVEGNNYVELFLYGKELPAASEIKLSGGVTVEWNRDAERTKNPAEKQSPKYESIIFNRGSTIRYSINEKTKHNHDHGICESIKEWIQEDLKNEPEEKVKNSCIEWFIIEGGSNVQPPQLSECCWECDVRDYDNCNEIFYSIDEGVKYYGYNLEQKNVKSGISLIDRIVKKCDPNNISYAVLWGKD
jgi:hypothetical protein